MRGLKNLVAYAKIVWNDHDWDYHFLLKLLEFKLRRMQKAMVHARRIDAQEIADLMGLCADALQRVMDDNYLQEELAAHEAKWGDYVCPVCGKMFCRCFPTDIGYHMVHTFENVKSLEDDLTAGQEYMAISQGQRDALREDVEFVFNTMRDNVLGWWD